MFGYATDETEECMPLTLMLAHQMNKKISDLRRDGTLWWARPDTKTQVTCEYVFDKGACVPIRVHTVVVSCQHSEKVTLAATLLLEAQWEMLDSLEGKSLLILMEVGELMVVELSLARITPRWTEVLPMLLDGSPSLLSRLDFARGVLYRFPMLLV